MPRGDRTGPWGMGPRTGRGMGYCSGYTWPGYMVPGAGFGFGRGMGMGRGRGGRRAGFGRFFGFPYPPTAPFYGDPGGMPYGYPPYPPFGYPYPEQSAPGFPEPEPKPKKESKGR